MKENKKINMKLRNQCQYTFNEFCDKSKELIRQNDIRVGPDDSYVNEFVLYLHNLYKGTLGDFDLSYVKGQASNFCKMKVQGIL